MNLLIDLRCLQDNWRTGVGEYAWNIIKHLPDHVDRPIIGYASAFKKINLPVGIDQYLTVKGSHIPNKIKNLQAYLSLGKKISDEVKTEDWRADVVWAPNPMFLNLDKSLPTVLTIHDLSFVQWPNFFKRRGHLWYFPAVKKLIKAAPKSNITFACVSKYTADEVLRFVPEYKKNIEVIYPAVDESYFKTDYINKMSGNRFTGERPYIMTVGTLEPRKNHLLLIEAYQNILKNDPNWPYDLVMAGPWGWRTEKLKKVLANNQYKNRIHITGYLKEEEKKQLLAGASLFLYPSFYEGFGMPVLEAMASSVPVITSLTSSLPEVVQDAGILLSPYDSKLWSEVIKQTLVDESMLADLRERGLNQARKFTWTASAEKYAKLFKQLCA